MFSRLILASAAVVGLVLPAAAHPHVWITMRSDVVFNETREISAIGVEWVFDDGYAEVALEGLDVNSDGVFSQSELAPLTEQNMASLKDYNYFVAPSVDGEVVSIGDPREAGQIYSNGKLALHFQVPLATPVDPRKAKFLYKVYDPEFFIAIDYVEKDPVGIVGKMPEGCRVRVEPVVGDEQLLQTQQMLSDKGADWKPETYQDFGGMFAQPAMVLCQPTE